MSDDRLRRLSRGELIDIIYQYQCKNQEQAEKIEELTAQLEDRRTRIRNAGSIAEAALSLNRVFEAAQQAADQYVQELKDASADPDDRCKQIIAEAEEQAALIRRQAEIESEVMLDEAKQKCQVLYRRMNELKKQFEAQYGPGKNSSN